MGLDPATPRDGGCDVPWQVGYSQGSKLPAEFDVTKQLRAGPTLVIVLQARGLQP